MQALDVQCIGYGATQDLGLLQVKTDGTGLLHHRFPSRVFLTGSVDQYFALDPYVYLDLELQLALELPLPPLALSPLLQGKLLQPPLSLKPLPFFVIVCAFDVASDSIIGSATYAVQ